MVDNSRFFPRCSTGVSWLEVLMHAMSDGSADALEDTVATLTCVLIAPSEVSAALRALNLEYESVAHTLPEPLPASGLVVCVPGMPVYTLPPGWAGVWARPEAPP